MAFLIDEAYLPAVLTVPPMSDRQFAEFCAEHPDLFFEMTAEGELIVMAPAFSLTGARNAEILRHLGDWAHATAGELQMIPRPASFFPVARAVRLTPPGWPRARLRS